jgi:hypothetical protein
MVQLAEVPSKKANEKAKLKIDSGRLPKKEVSEPAKPNKEDEFEVVLGLDE